jgi:signal transduction histidine kinase
MNLIGKRSSKVVPSEVLLAYVQSWDRHGTEELSICSDALDVIRAYLGERPCCLWKSAGASGLARVCERGMIELFYTNPPPERQVPLTKCLVSSVPEFDGTPLELPSDDAQATFDGFLHVPVKWRDRVLGILTVAVRKREYRERPFVQALEGLARLIGISLNQYQEQENNTDREARLKAEVASTSRELESTNKRLIERVRELKTLSRELHKRVQELTHANRAKDEFLSIVSHELRTPLTSLNGFLCVILEEEAGPISESQRKFLTIAKQSADRLNALISDLLDISRLKSGRLNLDMGECDLFGLLKETFDRGKEVGEKKGIAVRFQAVPQLPRVWGDQKRLQQVLDHLISNALKFTEKGGAVDVICEENGDSIKVSVRDTGPGLSPEEQKQVFDMFYQVDASARRSAGGAGLGLTIAYGLISMHGGQLWVESEKGKGSTFSFVIPRLKENKAA